MVTKSANLYARIEPDVKEKAENILSTLGIPASSAINMFYKQIILQRGLPFEVKIPAGRPVDISTLSEAQFNEELEKGYADMQAGRTNIKSGFDAGKRNNQLTQEKLMSNQEKVMKPRKIKCYKNVIIFSTHTLTVLNYEL